MKLSFDQFIIDQSPPDLNYGLLSVVPSSRYSSLMPPIPRLILIFIININNINNIK